MAELNNILQSLKGISGSGLEKVAAAGPAPAEKVSAAETDLVNALNNALTSATAKTASVEGDSSATTELLKVASDLATADREGLMKEAELFGGAFADGCMSRLAQYDAAALADPSKTASAPENTASFDKWAQENPAEFQRNFEAGYKEAAAELEVIQQAELEKLASTPEGREKIAAFDRTYAETAQQLEKLAASPEGQDKIASFNQGYAQTVADLEKIASEPDGQEKLASLQAGFAHGAEMVEKLASDFYTRGYNDTAELLRNV